MLCNSCGYPHSEVVSTRKNESRGHTERRRECLKCGVRFTTHERLYEPRESKLVRQTGPDRR
jgi:transcriptional repressor NrdR